MCEVSCSKCHALNMFTALMQNLARWWQPAKGASTTKAAAASALATVAISACMQANEDGKHAVEVENAVSSIIK